MMLYIKNSKIHTHIPLELINVFISKITGYKINTHKSTVFLCTSNEQSESEIKKIPVHNRNKLDKNVQNLYTEKNIIEKN